MAEVPKRYFERYFLLVGIACVMAVSYIAQWIYSDHVLRRQIKDVATGFNSFKKFEDPIYLPDVLFLDPFGKEVRFRDFRGKYLVVNIWATWCKPCVTELPSLKQLNDYMGYGGKWRVMAISIDHKDNLPNVAAFTQRYGVSDIANYYDHKNEIQMNLPIKGLPVTYIVTDKGRILYEIRGGGLWHGREVIEFLENIPNVH